MIKALLMVLLLLPLTAQADPNLTPDSLNDRELIEDVWSGLQIRTYYNSIIDEFRIELCPRDKTCSTIVGPMRWSEAKAHEVEFQRALLAASGMAEQRARSFVQSLKNNFDGGVDGVAALHVISNAIEWGGMEAIVYSSPETMQIQAPQVSDGAIVTDLAQLLQQVF